MNFKKIILITLIAFFAIGIMVSAADAAHVVKKGKYHVKISNKDYEKLNSYELKYKKVQKTRTVTKYKTVTKERKVTKYNRVIVVANKNGTVHTKFNEKDYDDMDMDNFYRHLLLVYDDKDLYFENEPYTDTEEYKAKVPYTVKEKYYEKVPYKVRKDVSIRKKVGTKYVKEGSPIVKTVKVKKGVGKWKYVGEFNRYDYTASGFKKQVQKNAMKLKKQGYYIKGDINKNVGIKIDGTYIKLYIKAYKKVTVKEKQIVGYKWKKTKRPVYMNIYTWKDWDTTPKPCAKGKVNVMVCCKGPITIGTVKIK